MLTNPTPSTSQDDTDDFFVFGETPAADVVINEVDRECANYFGIRTQISTCCQGI